MKSFFILFLVFLISSTSFGQLYLKYSEIEDKDIIDALAFSGIGIYKFEIDSLIEKHNFYLIIDEFAGKDNLIKSDTLFGLNPFQIPSEEVSKIRFITKVVNNLYDKVSLYISTPHFSTWKEIEIDKKYRRKHYWIEFEKSQNKINTKIPLLFFGSEWDDIYNGQMTTRFCSRDKMELDLSGDAINMIPHFYIIYYLIK